MRFWEPCVGRWDWVSAVEEVPVNGMALEQRASPQAPPTWVCLQLPPHLQAQPPVSGLGLLPTVHLHSTARYVVQGRPRVTLSLRPEKVVGRGSPFLICGRRCQSWTGDNTGLVWKGWGQRLGHFALLMPSSGNCRIPSALEAGDLGHSDRSSHLPGMSCSLQCPLSPSLYP